MLTLPTNRETRPPNFSLAPEGGLTIIPRRGFLGEFLIDSGINGGPGFNGPLATRDKLFWFAAAFPGHLSEILGTVHPTVSKAQSNWITATCDIADVKLTAYKGVEGGEDTPDDGATAEVTGLLKSFGDGVGGLNGLRVKGAQAIIHYGLWAFEAIPGRRGQGVVNIGLVDPISIGFANDPSGRVVPFQFQPDAPNNGRRMLSESTFFWYSRYASAKNPYGISIFAAAVSESLKEMAFDQDVSDSVHNAAWQRYCYKYSLETLFRIATTKPEDGGLGLLASAQDLNTGAMTNPAMDWVNGQLAAMQTYLSSLNSDDNLTMDTSGGLDIIAAASYAGIEPILQYKDYRLIRALDELPTTMGAPKAGAQTTTTAEWAGQAAKQEAEREAIMEPILKMLNLHFQLQGRPIKVKAEYQPIRKADAVQDANVETVRAKNTRQLWVDGVITGEEYALRTTGSGWPAGVDPHAYQGAPEAETLTETAPLSQAGTSSEETDATKQAQNT